MQVLKTNVLIKPDGKKLTTDAGLQMVNFSLEGGLRRGTIVSIGSQVYDVEVGDRVAYPVQEGSLVKVDGVEHALMHFTQLYGILQNENLD